MKDQNLEKELKQMREELEQLKNKSWSERFKQKSSLFKGIVIGLSLTTFIAIAGQITLTHTFTAGNTISASEMNTNFNQIVTKINDMNKGVYVELSAVQNVTCDSTYYELIVDNVIEGDGGYNTANYTYTVSTTGLYNVTWAYDTSHTSTYIEVLINGVTSMGGVKKLNVGDTVKPRVGCSSSMGPTSSLQTTGTFFALYKVL
ncbi:MAG: hypothetical protein KC478_09640 [Bacteriovoracaceae bacterium]|nr:hypothetical protein [Bacteriovoracaceae bacterium]